MIAISPQSSLPAILESLISSFLELPPNRITATGAFPDYESLTIDLTHAKPRSSAQKPPLPQGNIVRVLQTFSIAKLTIIAKPFGTPDRPLLVDAAASNVQLEVVETADAPTAIRLAAGAGRAHAALDKSVLRAVLFDEASRSAAAQGVSIKEIIPTFTSSGPRSLNAVVVVKAKKGFLPTATLRITGQLSVDENLTGRIHTLAVTGDGIGGNVAAGFIRPKLAQLEGKTHSLLALPLDAIRISDVRIRDSAAALEVEVDFAS